MFMFVKVKKMKNKFYIPWKNKFKFIAICMILHILIIIWGFCFEDNIWSPPAMFEEQLFTPTDLIFNVGLHNCSFAKKYHNHIINASILREERFLKDYQKRLSKVFDACHMKNAKIFFSQIDDKKIIKMTVNLTEKQQIENMVNYYYLIEPNSLLSEMKRINYQSRDALLIIEKLEIDIAWDKRYDFKGEDEHFNRLVNKI